MIESVQLSDEERAVICSCLIRYLHGDQHPSITSIVRTALRKLEGVGRGRARPEPATAA